MAYVCDRDRRRVALTVVRTERIQEDSPATILGGVGAKNALLPETREAVHLLFLSVLDAGTS